jgi:helicase MOV-10
MDMLPTGDSTDVNDAQMSKARESERERALKIEDEDALNVYARPYIPYGLRLLNELPAVIFTKDSATIDFDRYVQSFTGADFVSIVSPDSKYDSVIHWNTSDIDKLKFSIAKDNIEQQYLLHFKCLIALEVLSHKKEYDLYSMYDAAPEKIPGGQLPSNQLVFRVPGLQEDERIIYRGDPIQLRLLSFHNSYYRLKLIDQWRSSQGFPHIPHNLPRSGAVDPRMSYTQSICPGFFGEQINATVFNVHRRTERIVVDGYSFPPEARFNIVFPIPETPYRSMLKAVSILDDSLQNVAELSNNAPVQRSWVQSMLFPIGKDGVVQVELDPSMNNARNWIDQTLNHEQRKAVHNICSMNYGRVPFLISGPPGTGKTKTLVETALQLIKRVDNVDHILICTPSNSSADVLISRLQSHFRSDELLRLCSPSRTIAEVPVELRGYCNISDDSFVLPEFRKLMSCKIVVTTCLDASMLQRARLTNCDLAHLEHSLLSSLHPFQGSSKVKLHWDALLLDEAAQATEPLTAIPIAVVAPPRNGISSFREPILAMAGDEHQLGPKTYSLNEKLRRSLFARIAARKLYADHELARGTMFTKAMLPIIRPPFTNLINNYRSHLAILAVPSYLFYADTLMDKASDADALLSLSIWQGNKWPVLFLNNQGLDQLDQGGAGWFNVSEIRTALTYADKILKSSLIQEEEIFVMSPFPAQVARLRKAFQAKDLWKVNIGPCEAFQGLENRFVILCTTRARKKFVQRDVELCRGVIHQPQLMNVSLTRAKQGLIVIGNADLLSEDTLWLPFLQFCARNGLHNPGHLALGDIGSGLPLPRMERVLLGQMAASEKEALGRAVTDVPDDDMWEELYHTVDYVNYEDHMLLEPSPSGIDGFPEHISRGGYLVSDDESSYEINENDLIPKDLFDSLGQ